MSVTSEYKISSESSTRVTFKLHSVHVIDDKYTPKEDLIVVVTVKTFSGSYKSPLCDTFVISLASPKEWITTSVSICDLICTQSSSNDIKSNSHILVEVLYPDVAETFTSKEKESLIIPGYKVKAFGIVPLFETVSEKQFLAPSLLQGRQTISLFKAQEDYNVLSAKKSKRQKKHQIRHSQLEHVSGNLESSINWEDKLLLQAIETLKEPHIHVKENSIIVNGENIIYNPAVCGYLLFDYPTSPFPVYLNTPQSFSTSHFCFSEQNAVPDSLFTVDDPIVNNVSILDLRRDILKAINAQYLSDDQKKLIFENRYQLDEILGDQVEPQVVVKFLQSVPDWSTSVTTVQRLLSKWKKAGRIPNEIGIEMLFVYANLPFSIREFCVELLLSIDTTKLLAYLLPITKLLPQTHDLIIKVESESKEESKFENRSSGFKVEGSDDIYQSMILRVLLEKAARNFAFANYLFWFMKVELNNEDSSPFKVYLEIFKKETPLEFGKIFDQQEDLRKHLMNLYFSKVHALPNSHDEAFQLLKKFKIEEGFCFPIRPEMKIRSIDSVHFFDSNTRPIRLSCTTVQGTPFSVIYKFNDDLNLDNYFQAIVKLIVDNNANNPSLASLTPYEALPLSINKETSNLYSLINNNANDDGDLTKEAISKDRNFKGDGFIEFVPSSALFDMYNSGTSFDTYFARVSKETNVPLEKLMRELLYSSAGYAVLSYVFGIGDRHMRNILVHKNSGKIFHIDFGYLFDNEPPFKSYLRSCVTITSTVWDFLSKHEENFYKECEMAFKETCKMAGTICRITSLLEASKSPKFDERAILLVKSRLNKSAPEFIRDIKSSSFSYTSRLMESIYAFKNRK